LIQRLQKLAAGGMIFLLPFFVVPFNGDMQMQFEVPKLMAVFLLGNLCFAFYLGRQISPFFGLIQISFAASVLFTGFGGWQIYPMAYLTASMAFALWFAELKEADRVFYLKIIAVSGLLCAFQAYLQTFGFTWPLTYGEGIDKYKPIAFMGQHTKLGALLAPLAALTLSLGWLPAAAFLSFIVLLTGSSFSFLALGAGLLVSGRHLIGLRRTLQIVALGAVLTAGAFLARPNADVFLSSGRGDVWRETVECARQAPWFGRGPGAFAALFGDHCESKRTRELYGKFFQSHNDYLQVYFDGGLFGVAALVLVLLGILRAYYFTWWQRKISIGDHLYYAPAISVSVRAISVSVRAAQGILAALLANAIGNFPFQLEPHALLGLASAAILLKSARHTVTLFPWPLTPYFSSRILKPR
jgi:O-antigen ligase